MDRKYIFVVAQKAVIKEGGKYLVLKRSPDMLVYPGVWDFPGGRLEREEEPEKGLKREVMEETGLKVDVGKPVFVFQETVREPVVFILYSCRRVSGKVALSNEHTEFMWAGREELLKMGTEGYLRAFLQKQSG